MEPVRVLIPSIFVIFLILALQSCDGWPSGKDRYFAVEDSTLNLGFEEVDENGQPQGWFLISEEENAAIVNDEASAFQGKKFLSFKSTRGHTFKSRCLNAILSDIVKKGVKVSVAAHYTSDSAIAFGFFYQSTGLDTLRDTVFIEVDKSKAYQQWQVFHMDIPVEDIHGNVLDFGFWVNGQGELWLDAWEIRVDEQTYKEATRANVPPLRKDAVEYLYNAVVPLNIETDMDSFAWLRDAVGDADFVLLGEDTHGTEEFVKFRKNITQFLVEEMNFTTVILESNLAETQKLNDNLRPCASKEKRINLINDLNFWIYRTEEFDEFIKWFCGLDSDVFREVNLAGCDFQAYELSISLIQKFSNKIEDEKLNRLIINLQNNILIPERSIYFSDTLLSYLIELKKGKSISTEDQLSLEIMVRYAVGISYALNLRHNLFPWDYRDLKMAENVAWLLDRKPKQKTILWAHNEHIKNGNNSMGHWLKRNLIDRKIFTMGLTSGGGKYRGLDLKSWDLVEANLVPPPPESWEYYFHKVGFDAFFLDLRDPNSPLKIYPNRRMRSVGAAVTPKQFFPSNITVEYDALVYFGSTSGTHFY